MLPNYGRFKQQNKVLSKFISRVRGAVSPANEKEIILEELANIREKLLDSAYLRDSDRCRLLLEIFYIWTLGYPIDQSGIYEALNLCGSSSAVERQIGLLLCSCLYANGETSRVIAAHWELYLHNVGDQRFALNSIANVCAKEQSAGLLDRVLRFANTANGFPPDIRRRAYICLARFHDYNEQIFPAAIWAPRFAAALEFENDNGCLLSLSTLVYELLVKHCSNKKGWGGWAPVLTSLLNRLEHFNGEQIYYGAKCPWTQIKLMHCLRCFTFPSSEKGSSAFNTIAISRLEGFDVEKSDEFRGAILLAAETLHFVENFSQILRSATIEKAFDVAMLFSESQQTDSHIKLHAIQVLGTLSKRANKKQLRIQTIQTFLKEKDLLLRKGVLELILKIGNKGNWEELTNLVFEEILSSSSPMNKSLHEEGGLVVSILTEKFAEDKVVYLDTVFRLLNLGVNSSSIWTRVVQIVVGNSGTAANDEERKHLQKYASERAYSSLKDLASNEKSIEEKSDLLKLSLYLVGEFPKYVNGHSVFLLLKKIAECLPKEKISDESLKFNSSIVLSQILTSVLKLHFQEEAAKRREMKKFIEGYASHFDPEIQQRGLEYTKMSTIPNLQSMMKPMPRYKITENSISISSTTTKSKVEWRQLCLAKTGTLFSESNLKIQMKLLTPVKEGRVDLELGFSSSSFSKNQKLEIEESNEQPQEQELSLEFKDTRCKSFILTDNRQYFITLRIKALKPFYNPPAFKFTVNGTEQFKIYLPIAPFHFIQPAKLSSSEVKSKYEALKFASSTIPLNSQTDKNFVTSLFKQLNLTPILQVDENDSPTSSSSTAIFGCGVFHTFQVSQSIPLIVRFKLNALIVKSNGDDESFANLISRILASYL